MGEPKEVEARGQVPIYHPGRPAARDATVHHAGLVRMQLQPVLTQPLGEHPEHASYVFSPVA